MEEVIDLVSPGPHVVDQFSDLVVEQRRQRKPKKSVRLFCQINGFWDTFLLVTFRLDFTLNGIRAAEKLIQLDVHAPFFINHHLKVFFVPPKL